MSNSTLCWRVSCRGARNRAERADAGRTVAFCLRCGTRESGPCPPPQPQVGRFSAQATTAPPYRHSTLVGSHHAIQTPSGARLEARAFRCLRGVQLNIGQSLTARSKNYDGSMRITSKGQVTIPLDLRERYGLMPETEVAFVERDGSIVLERTTGSKPDRGALLVASLRGSGNGKMSTDEIMQLTRNYDDE